MTATDRRVLAALSALAERPVRVPVIGGPPRWKWFPAKPDDRYYWFNTWWSMRSEDLWNKYFTVDGVSPHSAGRVPAFVYFSRRMSREYHARTYHWGIVISEAAFKAVNKRYRVDWMSKLLLHELLHWSGYGHDARFRAAAKRLGTW